MGIERVVEGATKPEVDITDAISMAIRRGIEADIETPPVVPLSWKDKTIKAVSSQYSELPQISKRAVHVLTQLGESFPNCATFDAMTRPILRTTKIDSDKLLKLFKRFQDTNRQAGNTAINASIAFSLAPLLSHPSIKGYEQDLLREIITVIPPLIFLSFKNANGNDTGTNLDGLPEWAKTKEESAHEERMNRDYGPDPKGNDWLTSSRATKVLGNPYNCGSTSKDKK